MANGARYSRRVQLMDDYHHSFHWSVNVILALILCAYGCHLIYNLLLPEASIEHLDVDDINRLESNDVFVSMKFHSLEMIQYINIHGVFAIVAVVSGLIQKYGIQKRARHLIFDDVKATWFSTNKYWDFHQKVGYLTIGFTLTFAVLGWISSDYSAWKHFASNAKYWLFFPYILIIPLVLIPIKTNILNQRKKVFYHRLFGNLFIKMLYLGPLSRIMISIFQKINVYGRINLLLDNEGTSTGLSQSNLNEYNYYYAVLGMALLNTPLQLYEMYHMFRFVNSNNKIFGIWHKKEE